MIAYTNILFTNKSIINIFANNNQTTYGSKKNPFLFFFIDQTNKYKFPINKTKVIIKDTGMFLK